MSAVVEAWCVDDENFLTVYGGFEDFGYGGACEVINM